MERLLADDDDLTACALWGAVRELLEPRLGDERQAFNDAISRIDLPLALEILRRRPARS